MRILGKELLQITLISPYLREFLEEIIYIIAKLNIILNHKKKFSALLYGLKVFSENRGPENSMDKYVLTLQWFEIPRRLDKLVC